MAASDTVATVQPGPISRIVVLCFRADVDPERPSVGTSAPAAKLCTIRSATYLGRHVPSAPESTTMGNIVVAPAACALASSTNTIGLGISLPTDERG